MLTYTLEKKRGRSLYTALYEAIRADIEAGRLRVGERLPSKRALAAHLAVSVATVEAAYAQLTAEGYVRSRERSGFFVCAIGAPPARSAPAPSLPPPKRRSAELLDLSGGGGADAPFPFSVWAKTMRTVLAERGRALLEPMDLQGAPELRRAIAEHLYRSRGLRLSAEQIVVGAGNEYLYGLLAQLLGRERRYAIEEPGYPKIAAVYAANGVPLCRVPLDADGLSVAALAASGAELAHISPAHHYPTGTVMPIRRRNELLAWAYAAPERYIIEDDYDSELRLSGRPLPPLFELDGQQRVLYLSTFSQTIAPSLRLAYVCLPGPLLERLREKLGFYSCTVPAFEQYTLARFIDSGDYERHVNRLKKRLREKRTAILTRLAESPLRGRCSVIEENAGTHFLLRLQTPYSDAELKRLAAERGVSLRCLSDYQADPADTGRVIVNYACMELERLPVALELLAGLCTAPHSE